MLLDLPKCNFSRETNDPMSLTINLSISKIPLTDELKSQSQSKTVIALTTLYLINGKPKRSQPR